jgi:hypothetical protein
MSRSYATKLLGRRFSSFLISGLLSVVTFVLVSLVFPQDIYAVDITLTWDASSQPDLDGYRVYCRQEGDSYNYNHPDWAGNRTETTCTIYGLDDNNTYYFVVRAVDVEGNESGDSNEIRYQPNAASTQVIMDNGDTGGGGGGGGCFIATAAFGSPMEAHVTILKNVRDNYLLPCSLGRSFVITYYKYSPPVAHFIAKHEILRAVVRIGLLPVVGVSYSMLHFGPTITLTMVVCLLVIPILVVASYRRKSLATQ